MKPQRIPVDCPLDQGKQRVAQALREVLVKGTAVDPSRKLSRIRVFTRDGRGLPARAAVLSARAAVLSAGAAVLSAGAAVLAQASERLEPEGFQYTRGSPGQPPFVP